MVQPYSSSLVVMLMVCSGTCSKLGSSTASMVWTVM